MSFKQTLISKFVQISQGKCQNVDFVKGKNNHLKASINQYVKRNRKIITNIFF